MTADIRTAIDHAECEIELLSEYRTRLIADVVTGKLDVREAAGRLPDEPDYLDTEGDLPLESEDEVEDDADSEEVDP